MAATTAKGARLFHIPKINVEIGDDASPFVSLEINTNIEGFGNKRESVAVL